MSEDVAIKVADVSKYFAPSAGQSSIKAKVTGLFKSKKEKKDPGYWAVRDISFEVKKGEFFGIVGRNGSGKSTLLKMIAGVYSPTKGEIKVDGKLVPFIELGVGFNPELSGRDNVFLNGALLGFNRSEMEAMYDEIVDFAELREHMDVKLKNFSSGMQVRLAFSIAIRAESDVLLVDEVLAVGDTDFQRKCFDYFKQLKRDKKTVVFVSHDMNSVREYCDRAVLIDGGSAGKVNDASKVATQYTKLFNNTGSDSGAGVKPAGRWGTGDILFIGKGERILVNAEDKTIEIVMSCRAKTNLEGVLAGFIIRDATGKALFGTNAKLLGSKSLRVENAGLLEIKWSFENILSDGLYYFEPALVSDDGTTVYDWWEAARTIRSNRDQHTPYGVTPEMDIQMLEKK